MNPFLSKPLKKVSQQSTAKPSNKPSTKPSNKPSAVPSNKPSAVPSNAPSTRQSHRPSKVSNKNMPINSKPASNFSKQQEDQNTKNNNINDTNNENTEIQKEIEEEEEKKPILIDGENEDAVDLPREKKMFISNMNRERNIEIMCPKSKVEKLEFKNDEEIFEYLKNKIKEGKIKNLSQKLDLKKSEFNGFTLTKKVNGASAIPMYTKEIRKNYFSAIPIYDLVKANLVSLNEYERKRIEEIQLMSTKVLVGKEIGINQIKNLIQKTKNLNQIDQNFNQINAINTNNPLENVPSPNQKNQENYEELLSKFTKLGFDESSKAKLSSTKKPEQYNNFFQNPNMSNNNNKNNQKESDAFNYFFGSGMQGGDLSKKMGENPTILGELGLNEINNNNHEENSEENEEEKEENEEKEKEENENEEKEKKKEKDENI